MDVLVTQVGAALDPQRGHLFRPARADPEEPPDRQAGNELRAFAGADHAEPVWLVLVARQFGEGLVVGNPGAGGQPGFGLDPGADQLGDAGRGADPLEIVGDVEESLVQAERLDQRGIV